MFIDFAEMQAKRHQLISMQDWLTKTDNFLRLNEQNILQGAGKVSHEQAMIKAEAEYEKFRVQQDREYISQFDKELEVFLRGK